MVSSWKFRILCLLASSVWAVTPCMSQSYATAYQIEDVVEFGANRFRIAQLPLQVFISGSCSKKKPALAVPNSANNKGYTAKWAIQGGQLFLTAFDAEDMRGRQVDIGDIIEDASLPLRANWFTGKIQFPLGEFDFENQCWPLVVELAVEKGKVKDISAKKNAVESSTWNGMPTKSRAEAVDEEKGSGVVSRKPGPREGL